MTSSAIASARTSGSRASPVRTLPLCRITWLRVARPNGTRRECHLAASRRPPRPSLSSPSVLPPPPPAEEIDRRIAAFQAGLQRDGIDAALIVQSADLVYLSGTAQNAHLIVPAVGEPLLLVRRDLERARRESAVRRIEPFTSLRALPAALSACGLPERLRLGFELDVAARRRLSSLLRARARCRPRRLHAGAVVGALAQERVGGRAHPPRLRADPVGDGVRAAGARSRPPRVRCPQRARPSHAACTATRARSASAASTASFSTARCSPA